MSKYFKFKIIPQMNLFYRNIRTNYIKTSYVPKKINYYTQYETRDSFMNHFSNKKDNLKFFKPDTYIIPESNQNFYKISRNDQYEYRDF